MNRPNKKNIYGFTLIELLVVIGIISILTAVVVPSYSLIRNNAALNSETQELISALRLAQNQAMSAQTQNGTTCTTWGVHLEANKYIIYCGSWPGAISTTHFFNNGIGITWDGGSEVSFDRLYGKSADKTITISANGGNPKRIQVDAVGKISQL